MAQENIEIQHPNFCLFPQVGTFGTINTTETTTRFRVKNTAGGLVHEYTLSSNIPAANTILGVEYVGPINLSGPLDDLIFFTLEKVSSTQCIIKKWTLDVSGSLLNLENTITKTTTGNYYYDAASMAVEHYRKTFSSAASLGGTQINLSSTSRILPGQKLFLGPSSDVDNINATEIVTVDHVSGNTVYIVGNLNNDYVIGDQVSFYNYIYLFSDIGYAGNTAQGMLFQLDAETGTRLYYRNEGIYKNIYGSKWSRIADAIAIIKDTQILYVRPYNSYLIWRSQFMNNVDDDEITVFPVYDLVFDDYNIYKLAAHATFRDDLGNKTTYDWSTYNYQQDTLLPYTNSLKIYTNKSQMIGPSDTTTFYIQVRDQFNITLSNINVVMSIDGDLGAYFTPLNGQAITDTNGEASIGYTSGIDFENLTDIKIRADQSSLFTGSQYVWDLIRIKSDLELEAEIGEQPPVAYDTTEAGRAAGLTTIKYISSEIYGSQIYDPYKNTHYEWGTGAPNLETTVPRVYIPERSFYTSPGGNWIEGGYFNKSYWPWFTIGGGDTRPDGAQEPVTFGPPGPGYDPRSNKIILLDEFTQKDADASFTEHQALRLKQPLDFLIYKDVAGQNNMLEDGHPVYTKARQLDAEYDLHFSQLKLSKHTHYVDGDPFDELTTYVNLDQFVFVQDADPAFWSEKNPRETDVWIRMRPYAFSLDSTTLKFFLREVWTENGIHYDTGYQELVDLYGPFTDLEYNEGIRYCTVSGVGSGHVCILFFDAGGGNEGIEFLYQPPQIFHHNAIVYIHIEIFDEAIEPNFIYTDYWFKIIPDFNAPYLDNLSPDREQDQVEIDTDIYFEIKDDGAGINIDTLEVFLNSRILLPTTITEVSKYHYKINCVLPENLQYDKVYTVGVKVADSSDNENYLRDSYRFYTQASAEPIFIGFDPSLCKRGMPRFTDVSFIVLANGDGIDESTIRLQVHDADVTNKSNIIPIIYRVY